jgi:hypothetical protein
MPRFVILEHDHPFLHWDFMLEAGDALATWRLSAPPAAGAEVDAEAIGDHRPAYLDYEGPVSGGRGRVVRWDAGTFDWLGRDEGRVVVELDGGRVRGVARLERRDGGAWRAVFAGES